MRFLPAIWFVCLTLNILYLLLPPGFLYANTCLNKAYYVAYFMSSMKRAWYLRRDVKSRQLTPPTTMQIYVFSGSRKKSPQEPPTPPHTPSYPKPNPILNLTLTLPLNRHGGFCLLIKFKFSELYLSYSLSFTANK